MNDLDLRPQTINFISIASGIGGLDFAIRLAIPNSRTVCYVEREIYPASKLVSFMEKGVLDDAPIWSDVKTFRGAEWRGKVHGIIAGLPCQPYSVAGKQKGDKDERYLWEHYFRIVEEVNPQILYLENVSGLLRWFKPIGERIQELGYKLEAGLFSAEQVGATHKRERFFALAVKKELADCDQDGLYQQGIYLSKRESQQAISDVIRSSKNVGDSKKINFKRSFRKRNSIGKTEKTSGERSGVFPYFPPSPNDYSAWGEIIKRSPQLEPSICGVVDGTSFETDGLAFRQERLRALGNGVVPLTAALAFSVLWKRLLSDGEREIYTEVLF